MIGPIWRGFTYSNGNPLWFKQPLQFHTEPGGISVDWPSQRIPAAQRRQCFKENHIQYIKNKKHCSSSNIDSWLVHIINIAALNFLGNDMFKVHALSWTTRTQWLKETCLQLKALQRLQGLDLSRFNENIPHTATENLDVLHQGVLVQIVCQLLQIHPTSLRQIESQAATKLLVRLLHLRTLKTSEAYCVDSLALASKLLSF